MTILTLFLPTVLMYASINVTRIKAGLLYFAQIFQTDFLALHTFKMKQKGEDELSEKNVPKSKR